VFAGHLNLLPKTPTQLLLVVETQLLLLHDVLNPSAWCICRPGFFFAANFYFKFNGERMIENVLYHCCYHRGPTYIAAYCSFAKASYHDNYSSAKNKYSIKFILNSPICELRSEDKFMHPYAGTGRQQKLARRHAYIYCNRCSLTLFIFILFIY